MIVADSDVLIDSLRGRKPLVDRVALELKMGTLATTVVNCFELLSGAKTESGKKKVEKLLGALTILPVDEGAARRAAEVRRQLESEGLGIGMADYLIAGICLERDLVLLTRNRQHFERIAGLALGRLHGSSP
ncbi:MAG: type II toxin-antitoxin system VapC family toxin [Deltaproteobacteria bacterium]|nr:MAG: type II toxin-antitoxin system VapC family toxin [Deltaproteobacteria bacterium]